MPCPIKSWTNGVPFEQTARDQLAQLVQLPIVGPHVAAMADIHAGFGITNGVVIPTYKAIIPSAVGVDIGCGMMAIRTTLTSHDLTDHQVIFDSISKAVPHGGAKGQRDVGAWHNVPTKIAGVWRAHGERLNSVLHKHPSLNSKQAANQLGTLGGGNHFVEVCLDEADRVWLMLHSGSRGVGNRIGTYFIDKAKKEMERNSIQLPNKDLAYLEEGSEYFADYVEALDWAQEYARLNRELMMVHASEALTKCTKPFGIVGQAVNCHHNYAVQEIHYGQKLFITRKGAVRAGKGDWGIIPGSMGTRSFIVKGKGNAEAFESCSHGAGRIMARGQAKRTITLEDHLRDTEGVTCRKDSSVIDESPSAYKDIDAVMAAQTDLVEIKHTLKQVICIKG